MVGGGVLCNMYMLDFDTCTTHEKGKIISYSHIGCYSFHGSCLLVVFIAICTIQLADNL